MTGERFDCAADYLERAVEAEKNRHIHPVLGV
jgi:hypothetical protein